MQKHKSQIAKNDIKKNKKREGFKMIKKEELARELYLIYRDEDLVPDTADEAFKEGVLAACEYLKKIIQKL